MGLLPRGMPEREKGGSHVDTASAMNRNCTIRDVVGMLCITSHPAPLTCASRAGKWPPKGMAAHGIPDRYWSKSASEASWLMYTISKRAPRDRSDLYDEATRGVVWRQAGHHDAEK